MSREIFNSALAALSLLLTTVVSTASASGPDEGSVANSCVVFRLTPVKPPPGQPPYPPGTIVDTDNNTITLRGDEDQIVWFDVMLSNWECVGPIRGWQAGIGFEANLPPGVSGVHVLCGSASDCEAAGLGPPESPGIGDAGAKCESFPDPDECRTVWEDEARADWLDLDIAACSSSSRACGGTNLDADMGIADDGTERYGMSVALQIDASFLGTVQIPFTIPDTTFVIPAGGFKPAFPGKTIPATVIVDPIIPTVSGWGLVVLGLGLLAMAKTRSVQQERWGRL